jgi:PAS domain S-box-containing protein
MSRRLRGRQMARDTTWVNRRLLPYGSTLAVTVAASVWRDVMVRNLGDSLPLYVTFYPAVVIVSLVFGLRQGLLATLYSVLMVAYWNLPREGTGIADLADVVGMVLFAGMCVGMAVVAEAHRRARDRVAAYEKQQAVQKSYEALRCSEERYRSLVVATAQVVWTTNPNGEVTSDMPMWRAFTGQNVDQIQGWGWIESIHPDDRDRTAEVWRQAVPTKTPYETVYRLRRHDRQYCQMAVRGVPVLGEDGEVREWVGTCTDITERKQAEGEMRKQAALLELVPAAIIVRDINSKIVSWNRGAEVLYGWSKSEALGKVTHELLHAQYPQPVAEIERSVLGGNAWEGELAHTTASGKRITVASRWAPQYDDKRQAIGFLEINVDITARKQAEQELSATCRNWSAAMPS